MAEALPVPGVRHCFYNDTGWFWPSLSVAGSHYLVSHPGSTYMPLLAQGSAPATGRALAA